MSRGEHSERPHREPRPSALNDLRIGLRLSMTGGRESVLRTLLTAVGVGLAAAMLLLGASLPTILDNRAERAADRLDYEVAEHPQPPAADGTLLSAVADDWYLDEDITGRVVRSEGPDAPLPPGVETLPGDGEMVVSPALADLLEDPEHEVLERRFDAEVVGEIGPEGLGGPQELAHFTGSDDLDEERGTRLTHYGGEPDSGQDEPVILLLGVVGTVVMLTPALVFLAAAVRFGGDQRDRRLAALRLMGADRAATRRIASGETLVGTLAGLALGVVFFLLGRPIAEVVPIASGVFATDVVPRPVLAALVFLVVPVLSLWVAQAALRNVVVEPFGVVRRAERPRQRLWWRLVLLALGAAMLVYGLDGSLHGVMWAPVVAFGVLAVLLGTTAVLPWLLDRLFDRASGGPLSLQLALRRLGTGGGGPVRAVSGIVVTVAGAIALQGLFASAEADMEIPAEVLAAQAYEDAEFGGGKFNLTADLPLRDADDPGARFEDTPGVEAALAFTGSGGSFGADGHAALRVADCSTLMRMADLPGCSPGDAFSASEQLAPGDTVSASDPEDDTALWQVPEFTPVDEVTVSADSTDAEVVLATPQAAAASGAEVSGGELSGGDTSTGIWLRVDHTAPEMQEEVRATATAMDPLARVVFYDSPGTASPLDGIRDMLLAGAVAAVVLVAAGMLVGTIEQVRERKRVHAVLTAFGTRRRTLVASVLWQTALPVLLGIAVATAVGTALGAALMGLTGLPVGFDLTAVLLIAGSGTGAVFLATLLAVPALLRTMRPEGLRSE
ncbi:FtsX-like permease family protein [Nocardiopsis nanhaiensis]